MSVLSDEKAIELVRQSLLKQAKKLRMEAGDEGNAAKYTEAAEIYQELGRFEDASICRGAAEILRGAA